MADDTNRLDGDVARDPDTRGAGRRSTGSAAPVDPAEPTLRDDAISSQVRRPIADDLAPERGAPDSGDLTGAPEEQARAQRGDDGTPDPHRG